MSSSMSSWESISQLAKTAPALNDNEFDSFLSSFSNPQHKKTANNESSSSLATSTAESHQRRRTDTGGHLNSEHLSNYQKQLQKRAPQIPDLRFEHSYRKSIAQANGSWWKIALITIRDQVSFPLIQGFLWNLTLVGIKTWRLAAASSGGTWGSKYTKSLQLSWS